MKVVPRADRLSDQVEDAIEKAYWEFKARSDPTQDKYVKGGERYNFKMAVRGMFYNLRDERE